MPTTTMVFGLSYRIIIIAITLFAIVWLLLLRPRDLITVEEEFAYAVQDWAN